jgi:protein-S-isoprenylcysteine O-methyltransferase Ste14
MAAEPGGGQPADNAGVPIPPPLIYLAGFGGGLALEAAWPIDGLDNPARWIVGLAGILGWVAIGARAFGLFRRKGTAVIPTSPASTLVTTGPFRFTRNPMYVGFALLYAGLAVWLDVIWALIVLPLVIVAVDRIVIAREERYLERRFGDEYVAYKQRVRRWL